MNHKEYNRIVNNILNDAMKQFSNDEQPVRKANQVDLAAYKLELPQLENVLSILINNSKLTDDELHEFLSEHGVKLNVGIDLGSKPDETVEQEISVQAINNDRLPLSLIEQAIKHVYGEQGTEGSEIVWSQYDSMVHMAAQQAIHQINEVFEQAGYMPNKQNYLDACDTAKDIMLYALGMSEPA